MKKHTQRQLLGLLKSIAKGITYIRENSQTNQTATVYQDCYAAVSMVSRTIDSELSEQRYAVYKELFAAIMNHLEQSSKNQNQTEKVKSLDVIMAQLAELGSMLESEPEVRKEIVFFPYKASMWDSLESIWRAAKEDPHCDCYVVPIPYYSNGQMEYEGNLFPKDVPVIHYTLYKMDVQLPDVTYIHNPYDNYNEITQVDPSYFTAELKKHTKKLVYVPYYVVQEIVREEFCNLPSMKNIDLVVVQSESVREAYLKYVSRDKVVALGSPKFDKVINNKRNSIEIPQKWEEKIKGKKVVLYNTSLAVMLENPSMYLEKLLGVIKSFDASEGMILLWRPHPLMKSALESMRPKYLETYQQIEQLFLRSNAGILDVSPDPHSAIAVADVYYGDASSMFPLFAATGKPMVLQCVTLPEDVDTGKSAFEFEAMAVKDEKTMYGFSLNLNALFQIDLVTGILTFLGSIPNFPFSAQYVCTSMEVVGDKIILVPYSDRYGSGVPQFVEYSISNNTFTTIELQRNDSFQIPWKGNVGQRNLFNSSFRQGDSVFFIPYQYGAIVEYNVKTASCTYHEIPLDTLEINNIRSGYFCAYGCQTGSDLYLPLVDSNQVLKFSMESGEFSWLRVGKKESRFSSCYSDGESLWLVSFIDGSITKYNVKNSRLEVQGKASTGMVKYNGQGVCHGSIIRCDSRLLLVPRFGTSMNVYHIESKKLEASDVFPFSFPVVNGQYSKAVYFEGMTYLFDYCSRNLVKYDLETNTKEEIKLMLSDEEVKKLRTMRFNQLSLHQSNQGVAAYLQDFNFSELLNNDSIVEYLKMLVDQQDNVEKQVEYMQCINVNMDGTSGEKIHSHVFKML